MDLNTIENRGSLIEFFPKLENDPDFFVHSPCDTRYNCIAFAANRTDNFWWPAKSDGCYWPLDNFSTDFVNLVTVFEQIGYEICESWQFEKKFKKIALYADSENQFTHASRQMRNGLWTSKLGQGFDVFHSTPFSIESDIYGNVQAIMSIVF